MNPLKTGKITVAATAAALVAKCQAAVPSMEIVITRVVVSL